jgi:hypothetical protein
MVNEPDPAAKDRAVLEKYVQERLGASIAAVELACMTFDETKIYPLDQGLNKARTTHPPTRPLFLANFHAHPTFAKRRVALRLLFASARCLCNRGRSMRSYASSAPDSRSRADAAAGTNGRQARAEKLRMHAASCWHLCAVVSVMGVEPCACGRHLQCILSHRKPPPRMAVVC